MQRRANAQARPFAIISSQRQVGGAAISWTVVMAWEGLRVGVRLSCTQASLLSTQSVGTKYMTVSHPIFSCPNFNFRRRLLLLLALVRQVSFF